MDGTEPLVARLAEASKLLADRPSTLTYNSAELAALFRTSRNAFLKRRPALEARGFPARLPGFAGLWSKPAVDHWVRTNGRDQPPGVVTLGAPELDAARSALEGRYD